MTVPVARIGRFSADEMIEVEIAYPARLNATPSECV
jgi:hypothetical protein